jgi:dTDP-4-dehydrorhamnose 3,5-epimerase
MQSVECEIPGVLFIEPRIFGDSRGWFTEVWNKEKYEQAGIKDRFVQDNISYSKQGTLRGLHYQKPHTQGKLVFVLQGEVLDVVVDLRTKSPTFKKWKTFKLTGDKKEQLYIPEGLAHGFCVLSDEAVFQYKCTDKYSPNDEKGIRWDDPELLIPWPVNDPLVSDKDSKWPFMSALHDEDIFNEGFLKCL